MAKLQCPHCQSEEIEFESRLVGSDKSTSVGRWRLHYGLATAFAAGLFGMLCMLVSWFWLEPPWNEPAFLIAVLAFLFAAFVLGTTLYFSRWTNITQCHCRNCNLTWIDEQEDGNIDEVRSA